jgi:hypothetical protein
MNKRWKLQSTKLCNSLNAVSIHKLGPCIAQAVNCQLPTPAAQVWSQVRQNLLWTIWQWGSFLWVLWFPLPILLPPTAPYSSNILSPVTYSLDTFMWWWPDIGFGLVTWFTGHWIQGFTNNYTIYKHLLLFHNLLYHSYLTPCWLSHQRHIARSLALVTVNFLVVCQLSVYYVVADRLENTNCNSSFTVVRIHGWRVMAVLHIHGCQW